MVDEVHEDDVRFWCHKASHMQSERQHTTTDVVSAGRNEKSRGRKRKKSSQRGPCAQKVRGHQRVKRLEDRPSTLSCFLGFLNEALVT